MTFRLFAVTLLVTSLSLVGAPGFVGERGLVGAPRAAIAQDTLPVVVEVTGRGWGHGRGLGQFGAQGYAVNHGWSSARILDHFFGGTTAGPIPANAPVAPGAMRVDLRAQHGQSLRVNLGAGRVFVQSVTGARMSEDLRSTVRLSVVPGGIKLESGPSCDGPWTEHWLNPDHAAVDVVHIPDVGGVDGLLRVCNADGSSNWYPGYLRFERNPVRTVNIVTVEEYLRGVVPNESPPSWHPAALEAQAVAARSYAMAGDTRQQPYADTCDTTLCQVYYGYFRQTLVRDRYPTTAASTDVAIKATQGLVRLRAGAVARTEFSSSTGGWTAGGTFPAVEDLGDHIASNPNRSWSTRVDMRPWINAQGKGDLLTIQTIKNGLGPNGGRTIRVIFRFTGGTVTLSGNDARRAFGLRSDWMAFGPIPVQTVTAGNFVTASYQLFVRRTPSDGERAAWTADLVRGVPRSLLTHALARSDEWAGVMIDDLYRSVFGRSADPGGRGYWLGRMRAGLRFEAVAAHFYGSPEYFARSGGTNTTFVSALYRAVLGREPDPGGLAYWSGQLDAGRVTSGGVAAGFYASPESRGSRVVGLYRSVLGRGPDPGGLAYWTEQLLRVDDVSLAAQLAASDEFYIRAQR